MIVSILRDPPGVNFHSSSSKAKKNPIYEPPGFNFHSLCKTGDTSSSLNSKIVEEINSSQTRKSRQKDYKNKIKEIKTLFSKCYATIKPSYDGYDADDEKEDNVKKRR